MTQLSWIGLGSMGRSMAKNLALKANLSKPLIVYNRTPKRASDLKSSLQDPSALVVSESIEDAVRRADVIFTSLADDASVVSVFDAALHTPGGVAGKVFVETSTIRPDTTNAIAKRVGDAGGEFVAAPVFGAPAAAEAGTVVVVLGGKGSTVDRVVPYCNGVISRAIIDLRDREPGTATLLKVSGNSFILSMVETLAEGHAFAEKSGLSSDVLHKFLELVFPGPYAAYSSRMISGDYMRDEPLFSVDLARKDAKHAMDLAGDVGVDMKILKIVDSHLRELKDKVGPSGDLPGIYGVVREESGLPFSNRKE